MKKNILFALISLCLWACSEDEIKPYQGEQYLYFSQLINTTNDYDKENGYMEVSFNNYPTSEEITVKIGMSLIGKPLNEDTPYSVVVVEENEKKILPQMRLQRIFVYQLIQNLEQDCLMIR